MVAAGAICVTLMAGRIIPAINDDSCSQRSRVVSGLDQLFGEIKRGEATARDKTVMEFFSSRSNGTWTLLRTLPDGQSCIVASGRGDWQQVAPDIRETALEI